MAVCSRNRPATYVEMRRVVELVKLSTQSQRRLARLRSLAELCHPPTDAPKERLISYVIIEATNLWAAHCRYYFLSTAIGCRDASGAMIAIGPQRPATIDDALTFAIHANRPNYRGRRPPWRWADEPVWHSPRQFRAAMRALSPANMAAVNRGFATGSRVFDDLPAFRNFFAHKGTDTRKRVASLARYYTLSPRLRPHELLMSAASGRVQSLLLDYVDDLSISIGLMKP